MYNVPDCALITKKARVLAFACNTDFPEQPKLVKRRMQCSTDKDMGQANYQKKGGTAWYTVIFCLVTFP